MSKHESKIRKRKVQLNHESELVFVDGQYEVLPTRRDDAGLAMLKKVSR